MQIPMLCLSWAIVGQGFYELSNINLMEQEMIHYLLWDLTISEPNLTAFADRIKESTVALYFVVTNKSCEKDSFRKGVIEERQTVSPELTSNPLCTRCC